MRIPFLFLLLSVSLFSGTCKEDAPVSDFKTKHVIIIVVDGPRWSETWEDSARVNIPMRDQHLKPMGSFAMDFNNDGFTYTNSGHAAITTAFYEPINNSGLELPLYPSIFHYWRKHYNRPSTKAWVVASKDKLYILADSKDTTMRLWGAKTDCGMNGPFTGYRHDSTTLRRSKEVLSLHHPDLMLVNFREPDFSGHQAIWNNYIQGIQITDQYVFDLVQYIQADPYYAGTTAIFITNDHGRHLNSVQGGYTTHGDTCAGCRKIELIAIGPDFKENYTTNVHYDQRDIARTTSALLGFLMPTGDGQVMWDIVKGGFRRR
jgi:hypothetical protein